jgi:hypothetical protein
MGERMMEARPLSPNPNSLHLDHRRRGVPGNAKQSWLAQPCGELVEPKDEFIQKLNTKLQARLSVKFSQTQKRGSKGLR